jgi:thiol-disulfide isomerase/thioredoxin
MFRSLFLLPFVFSVADAFGQNLISGSAKDHGGDYALLYVLADAISNERVFVEKALIGPDGKFEFRQNVSVVTPYYIVIGSERALLYLEPGTNYQFQYPQPDANAFQRFVDTEVELIFDRADTNELNMLIRRFNALYFKFMDEHYYDFALNNFSKHPSVAKELTPSSKEPPSENNATKAVEVVGKLSVFPEVVSRFKEQVDAVFSTNYDNEYFKTYVEFSMSEIELLAGLQRKYYYESYFMSRQLPLLNPAFGSAFRLFYKNALFVSSSELQKRINVAVNVEKSSLALTEAFSGDTITRSPDLRALMCIYGLSQVKKGDMLLEENVCKTLQDFYDNRKGDEIGRIAERLLLQKKRFKQGWKIEDITLTDVKGNRWKWSEQESKPTYFFFFATWSTSSLKELAMIQKLHDEFGQDVQFVAVSMDRDIELMKKYLEANRGQKYLVLSGLGDPLLSQKMSIKSIPHAVFVDRDGAVVTSYTRRPSEGARMDIEKHVATLRAPSKGGVKTWKNQ